MPSPDVRREVERSRRAAAERRRRQVKELARMLMGMFLLGVLVGAGGALVVMAVTR
jgi:hypothetical protein